MALSRTPRRLLSRLRRAGLLRRQPEIRHRGRLQGPDRRRTCQGYKNLYGLCAEPYRQRECLVRRGQEGPVIRQVRLVPHLLQSFRGHRRRQVPHARFLQFRRMARRDRGRDRLYRPAPFQGGFLRDSEDPDRDRGRRGRPKLQSRHLGKDVPLGRRARTGRPHVQDRHGYL